MPPHFQYLPRMVDTLIAQTLREFPAVMLVGARAVGKSTTAERFAASVVRLDRPDEAEIFKLNPDAALQGLPEPVLLDEWQEVPAVLGAVKRAVDASSQPARFLITGSLSANLQGKTWPGTGRVIRIVMHPLSVAEQIGHNTNFFLDDDNPGLPSAQGDDHFEPNTSPLLDHDSTGLPSAQGSEYFDPNTSPLPDHDNPGLPSADSAARFGFGVKSFFDRLADGDDLLAPESSPDILGYIELALKGGFPEAVKTRSSALRARWLQSYLEQTFTRDPAIFGANRDPVRLRRFFEAYALSAGGMATDKTIHEAAGVNSKTASAYKKLLKNLSIIDELPAWTTNRLKRLTRAPKRTVVDSGLWATALNLDQSAVRKDGDLLGRLLDIFVTAQLRAEIEISESRPRLYHLRRDNGQREVDIVAELSGRRIVGIEIKATSAPTANDARHLAWLRDNLGDRFAAGVVLHTGPRPFQLEEKITAAPISTLWQ